MAPGLTPCMSAFYCEAEEEHWPADGNMSDYDSVQKSALKIKGVGAISSGKKKKKKEKESKHRMEQMVSGQNEEEGKATKAYMDKRTPAQIAFDKMQEKRQMERILNKASKTHKHRVEDFNRHLDNLTEHYDIPKVSWTK
ncbi:protein FAM32A-like [Nerophis ophidion]|uniref:protein FAM32A-like n=1 Tax=Nerophis ophidion TaxID=159077 RepID=UPI002AE07456|nr:protein FAM32A-like [Nerophis ophidion]XP_061739205.1 protein FAM32A-like [Nerophis ophidion]XP_061739206.1 protein FAM32A-like [Nerophis ophidion]